MDENTMNVIRCIAGLSVCGSSLFLFGAAFLAIALFKKGANDDYRSR